jgi:hypothetical protein
MLSGLRRNPVAIPRIPHEIKRADAEPNEADPARTLRDGYERAYNNLLTGAQLAANHWKAELETLGEAFGVLGLAPDMIESAAIVAESFVDKSHVDALDLSLQAAETERETSARLLRAISSTDVGRSWSRNC